MKKQFSKKEMQQFVMIAVLVAVIVVYCIWSFAITPLVDAQKKRRSQLVELSAKNQKTQAAINAIPSLESDLLSMNETLKSVVDLYAVRPVLGSSYQLGVRQKIDPIAKKASFSIKSVTARDTVPMPHNRANAPFSTCAVEISGQGSYTEIRDFLAYIEIDNPYIFVRGFTIGINSADVKRHNVTLRLECLSAPTSPKQL